MIKMTNESVQPITGHLVYDYSLCIKKAFLKDCCGSYYVIEKDGAKAGSWHMSVKLREFLEERGFLIAEIKTTYLKGIKKYQNVKIDVSRIMDGGQIRQLLIRVHADDLIDLSEKLKLISESVKKDCHVKSDPQTYQKIERC